MNYIQKLVLGLSALVLGISGNFASGQGAAVRHCTSEECACEEALRQNTVEALEDFLKSYPQSVSNRDSACGALAVPPDGQPVPEDQSHDNSAEPEEPELPPSEG